MGDNGYPWGKIALVGFGTIGVFGAGMFAGV